MNKAIEFNLLGKEVLKIWCEEIENHCQITIELITGEKIILSPVNPNDCDNRIVSTNTP